MANTKQNTVVEAPFQMVVQGIRPTASQPPALTVDVDSHLSEDYVLTDLTLVTAEGPSPLAVFLNANGDSEVVAIRVETGELIHACREPLSPSGWNMYGVGAGVRGISVDANGAAYVVGTDGTFLRNNGGAWLNAFPPVAGCVASDFALGSDGVPRAIDGSGKLYEFSSGAWTQVDTGQVGLTGFAQAPQGGGNSLWGQTLNKTVASNVGGQWAELGLPNGDMCQYLVVTGDGSPIALGDQGNYLYSGGQWQALTGWPSVANVSGASLDDLWAITFSFDNDGVVYGAQHLVNGAWNPVPNLPNLGTNQGSSARFAVGAGGAVWYVDNGGTAYLYAADSQTWQRQMTPTGMSGFTAGTPVTEVAAGQDPQGVPHVFYMQNGQLNEATLRGGGWAFTGNWGAFSNLGVTYKQDNHELIVYGADNGGLLSVLRWDPAGGWHQYSYESQNASWNFSDVKMNVSVLNDQAWFVSAVMDGALYVNWGNSEMPLGGTGDWKGMLFPVQVAGDPHNTVPTGFTDIIRLPFVASEENFYAALLDSSGNIHLVANMWFAGINMYGPTGAYGAYNQISGGSAYAGGAKQVSALIDGDQMARFYVTDQNDKLWVLRQTGTTQNDDMPFVWSQWHPLDTDYACLANGPGPFATTELYTVGLDNSLTRLAQSPTTKLWSKTQIKKPGGQDPEYVSQYLTEATFYDQNGNPVSNTSVTITVAEPAALWVNGARYEMTPGNAVTCPTNELGKLSVSTLAVGLHTPAFVLNASGLAQPQIVYPPQQIHDFFAGKQQLNGQTFGGAVIRNPVDALGRPTSISTASNLAQNSDGVASAVTQAAQINIPPTQTTSAPTPLWSLDVADPLHPRLLTLATDEEIQAALAIVRGRSAQARAGTAFGDFWSDLENYAEDVYHAIEHGAAAVQNAFVTFDSKAGQWIVQVTVEIENIGQQVLQFAIKAIHDVANVFTAAFQWIEAAVETLLDWLKALFDWGDIWNTKLVFEHLMRSAIPALQYLIEKRAIVQVQDFFSNLKGDIDQGFAYAQQFFEGKTFADLAAGPPSALRLPRAGGPGGVSVASLPSFGKEFAWLQNRLKDNFHGDGGLNFTPPVDVTGKVGDLASLVGPILQDFQNAMNQSGAPQDFMTACQKFLAFFEDLYQNPSQFADKAVPDFLAAVNALVDLAMDLVEILVVMVLDVIDLLLGGMDTVLTHPLNIPVVSWCYRKIVSGDTEDMTIVGLASLMLAIPATVIYKAANNKQPPFSASDVQQILQEQFVPPSQDPASVRKGFGMIYHYINPKVAHGLYGGLCAPLAFFDTVIDSVYSLEADPPTDPLGVMILGWPDVINCVLLQIFSLPDSDWNTTDPGERWNHGMWVAGWVPPITNAVLLCPPLLKIFRAGEIGKVVLTIQGLGLMGCGVAAAVIGMKEDPPIANGWDVAAAIFTPMNNALQILRLIAIQDETLWLPFGTKVCIDPFADVAAGVTQGFG
jgi:hypothetical protein